MTTLVSVQSVPLIDPQGIKLVNASGVVPVGASRFAFVVNSRPDLLYELSLNRDGAQVGAIAKRPIVGLAGALSDPEGIARIDSGGQIDLIIASSMSVVTAAPSGMARVNDGLVRIRYRPDGELHAQTMEGFRAWLVDAYPALADASRRTPDDRGGLNIEGIAWDPTRQALLFGVRSPVTASQISVLCIHLDTAAPWTTAALHAGPTLLIDKADFSAPQGIRDIDYDAARDEFLVIVGRSVSGGNAPFQLCTWNGSASSVVVHDVRFKSMSPTAEMKPEGVTVFPGDGPRTVVIIDDGGGFAVTSL